MIAAYSKARSNREFLNQTFIWDDAANCNQGIEIQPKYSLIPGQTYSIQQAIDHMIKYSDNNAFFFLTRHLDIESYKRIFSDLKIPYSKDTSEHKDYITAKEFSYFLRVLFNSTYIGKDLSNTALKTLSQVDYKDALATGLPKDIKLAHKFGITATQRDSELKKELHDCGLV